jgi:hypothetical protein
VAIHVTPKADRDVVANWRGGELSVRVTAAPAGGQANAAACTLLARELGVPKSAVSVLRGATSRHKQLEITGVTAEEFAARFGAPEPPLL